MKNKSSKTKHSLADRVTRPISTGERGGASLIVLYFMLFVLVVCTASAVNRFRESRSRAASETRLDEAWEAKAAAAVLDRIIQVRFPVQYNRDYNFVKKNCPAAGDAALEPFDAADLPVDMSRPVATTNSDPNSISCAGEQAAAGYTSIFGNINGYLASRIDYLESEAEATGYSTNIVRISSLAEAVRRFSSGQPPSYQIHYVIDSRSGRAGRFRAEGDVMLGIGMQSCGTTAVINANLSSVVRGDTITFTIKYSMAINLKVYELTGGTLIHEGGVAEDPNPQSYSFDYAPTASNTYRIEAEGTDSGCSSQSGLLYVEVKEPPVSNVCTVNPPRITDFKSSLTEVDAGNNVVLQWQTTGGIADVTLNGAPVSQISGDHIERINADTTFTLRVTDNDPVNDCPVEQQIVVRTRNVCNFSSPTVNFSAVRTTIQTGESVNLSWSIAGMESGGNMVFTEPNGTTHALVASGSDTRIFNSPGTYTFKITAKNICPDGTEKFQEKVVTIIVTDACAVPVINSFTVNPSTVNAGESQNITFTWNVSGEVTQQTINGTVVSGTSYTTYQPQMTTTYTLSVSGCGQNRQAQIVVTVIPVGGSGNEYSYSENRSHLFQAPPLGCNDNFEWFYTAVASIVKTSLNTYQVQNYFQTNYFTNPYGCSSPNVNVTPVIRSAQPRFQPARGYINFLDASGNVVSAVPFDFEASTVDHHTITLVADVEIYGVPRGIVSFNIQSPAEVSYTGLDMFIADPQHCTQFDCPEAPPTYGDLPFISSPTVSINNFPR